jgi:hypothetical protein
LKRKEERERASKKVYKDILKDRMEHELHNIPKTQAGVQPLTDNMVKVNL